MNEKQSRRCYDNTVCPYHEYMEEQVKKSLPRWAFISAISAMCVLSLSFAGWHIKSLDAFDTKYLREVKEFHKVAEQNRGILIELRTKQEMVLQRLGDNNDLRRFNFHGEDKEERHNRGW